MRKTMLLILFVVFMLASSSVIIFALVNNVADNTENRTEATPKEILSNEELTDDVEMNQQIAQKAMENRQKIINDFKEKHSLSKFIGTCPRQEALMDGRITDAEKRITLEEVKNMIEKKDFNFSELVKYPDFEGGSVMTWAEYWLDDNGFEKIISGFGSVKYVKINTDGQIIETQDLYLYNMMEDTPVTTSPRVENTFTP